MLLCELIVQRTLFLNKFKDKPKTAETFNYFRDAYELYSGFTMKDAFNLEEIYEIRNSYRDLYAKNGFNIAEIFDRTDTKKSPWPLKPVKGIMNYQKVADLVIQNDYIFPIVNNVLGEGFQYLGAETINCISHSHGPHRDNFHKYDILKVLIPLDGSNSETNESSLCVFPGSHKLSETSKMASSLSSWPTKELSQKKSFTTVFKENNDEISPQGTVFSHDYNGFTKLNFDPGDLVFFSARGIHCVHNQRSSHELKRFIGLLFLQPYDKDISDYYEYLSIPILMSIGHAVLNQKDNSRARKLGDSLLKNIEVRNKNGYETLRKKSEGGFYEENFKLLSDVKNNIDKISNHLEKLLDIESNAALPHLFFEKFHNK